MSNPNAYKSCLGSLIATMAVESSRRQLVYNQQLRSPGQIVRRIAGGNTNPPSPLPLIILGVAALVCLARLADQQS
jgi:hypothetical protein